MPIVSQPETRLPHLHSHFICMSAPEATRAIIISCRARMAMAITMSISLQMLLSCCTFPSCKSACLCRSMQADTWCIFAGDSDSDSSVAAASAAVADRDAASAAATASAASSNGQNDNSATAAAAAAAARTEPAAASSAAARGDSSAASSTAAAAHGDSTAASSAAATAGNGDKNGNGASQSPPLVGGQKSPAAPIKSPTSTPAGL